MITLSYQHTDTGFCKVVYKDKNTRQLYCFLDDGYSGNVNMVFHICSSDEEPICQYSIDKYMFEKATGGTDMDAAVNDIIFDRMVIKGEKK